MAEIENPADLSALTVELLSAYLANNTVGSEDLPRLIRETRLALAEDTASEPVVEEAQTFTPAVSVRKSQASSMHILSLIDGKPYKTLKRHLAANGLTPETYRERYKLPANYPMVAPDFAAKRRAIAEKIGLGNRPKTAAPGATGEPAVVPASTVSAEPAPESKPSAVETPAVKTSTGKGVASESAEPAVKANGKATPKPANAKDSAPVDTLPTSDAVASPALHSPEAKPKPKGSVTAGAPGASASKKKVGMGKGANADVAPASTADATPPAEPTSAPEPARKPRGKLGLFGKGQTTPNVDAAPAEGQTPSEALQAAKPRKAPKVKRMARAPKVTTNDAE